MTYFRELPNVNYQSTKKDRSSSEDFVQVKNIFRRAKLRDDLKFNFTSLLDYYIGDGIRPDQVADRLYGDPELDWVVLTSANIINIRDEWPLDSRELYDFALNKHGEDLNQIRHYETKINEAKRSIYVVTPQYLQLFLNDMRDIMNYSDSSQFIDIDLIQTENTRNTDPN